MGRPLGGLVLVLVGGLLLVREMGLDIPHWIISWPMIPIAVGLYIGARNAFRIGGWWIPVLVGLFFLINEEILERSFRHYFWPSIIIVIGLYMILRPRKSRRDQENEPSPQGRGDDYIDDFVMFGGSKKNIFTKNLQGGKVEAMFGGSDLNLMQADFQGTVELHFNVAFGGVKLLLPPQWNVRNELTAILGGVDDKRPIVNEIDTKKTLILKGTVMFGGVDIKSY